MEESPGRGVGASTRSLLIRIEQWRGAMPLEVIEEVVRAVAVTPLSGVRSPLLGYVDVRGELCPVVDTRRLFHLRRRPLRPSDRMVVLRVGQQRLIVPVDEAGRVATVRVMEGVPPETIAPGRSGGLPGLRAASVDELGGDIVALIDPVAVFGGFARGIPLATATQVGVALGP